MSWKIQGSREWLEMRRSKIMASDAPCIMEVPGAFKSISQLWDQKMTGEESYVNPAMKKGKEMEPIALSKYLKETNQYMEPDVVFHPDIPWMGASLDGITLDGDMAVEIKYSSEKNHDLAINGHIPEHYYPQLQHQLCVLGIDMMHYYSFNGTEGVIVEVFKDHKYIKQLLDYEKEFYASLINGIRPISRHYEEIVSQEWNDTTMIWKLIKRKEKDLKDQLKVISAEEEIIRKKLIDICGDKNVIGNNVKLTKQLFKSPVDYSKIEYLKTIDIDQYRKEPITKYSISIIE
jgi:putative phage-type endonuclease